MNVRQVTALLFAGMVALGCEDLSPTRNRPSRSSWTVVGAVTGDGCECSYGKQWFLMNKGASAASITITEYRNDVLGASTNYQRVFTGVQPGERKLLTCSPDNQPPGACNIDYSWDVDGYRYHGNSVELLAPRNVTKSILDRLLGPNKALAVASAEAVRLKALAEGEKVVAPDNACTAKCVGTGADCLRLDGRDDDGNDVVTPVISLIHGAGMNGTIEADRLLRALGDSTNPCQRTDLTIKDGSLSNSGFACAWSAGTGSLAVEVTIPELLLGKLSSNAGRLSLTFPRPIVYGPQIVFGDAGLNAQFGGHVSRADEVLGGTGGPGSRYVVMTVPRGCVSMRAR